MKLPRRTHFVFPTCTRVCECGGTRDTLFIRGMTSVTQVGHIHIFPLSLLSSLHVLVYHDNLRQFPRKYNYTERITRVHEYSSLFCGEVVYVNNRLTVRGWLIPLHIWSLLLTKMFSFIFFPGKPLHTSLSTSNQRSPSSCLVSANQS